MSNKYEELISGFESKLRKLISEYKLLQEENAKMKADYDRKQMDLMLAHQQVLELQKKCDHLELAKNLGGSESDRNLAQNRIMKMVREIDKCIALLDE